MVETVLKIGDLVFPVGSDRGITQSLAPIDNGDLRRTVNSALVDTTREVNRKFTTTINCTDFDAPTLAGVWKGAAFTVECIAYLNQVVNPANDTATLIRDAVTTSIIGIKADGSHITPVSFSHITFLATFAEDVVTIKFRPILDMLVVEVSSDTDEFEAGVGWSVTLEEV